MLILAVMLISVLGCGGEEKGSSSKGASIPSKADVRNDRGVMPTWLGSAARQFKDQPSPPLGINVVLIVVDTLRADRLGAYGYSKNTSPRIDAIAKESTLFYRYYAASPWTAPSFGTMFTGMSPSLHMGGQVLNENDAPVQKQSARSLGGFSLYPLRSDIKTLAEQLDCCVDSSAAFVSNPFLHPSLGFNRGFSTYSYHVTHRPAKDITDDAIAWVKQNAQHQFFTVIHYMDTHQPYAPDQSFRREFFPMDGGRLDTSVQQSFGQLQRMNLTADELAFLKGLYDAQIHTVDAQIGRVVDTMASLDLLDNSWLIITADHGEEHFDHGSFFHGLQYTDEVVRIPLIIRAPGGQWGAGNQVAYSACQQDLSPTIMGIFGTMAPSQAEGKSLMPLMTGEEKADRTCYMEMSMLKDARGSNIENQYRKHALFDGRYKVIQSLDGSDTRVYDLDNDALEKHMLSASHPGAFKSIRALHQYVRNRQPSLDKRPLTNAPATLPDDVGESLKNLGYVR
ncbi:MAG: sulfatase [Deltaproteobacteria bacterium]|nr:sulfatase [Deltaproteobacteria bacterium]